MNKDLIDDLYGRYREIPLALSNLGVEVKGICLSYQKRNNNEYIDRFDTKEIGVFWHSINLGSFFILGLFSFLLISIKQIKSFKPDFIIAGSDMPYVVFSYFLSSIFGIPFVTDIYDDLETFSSRKIPLMKKLYRYALSKSSGVVCFSNTQAKKTKDSINQELPVVIIENGVDLDIFHKGDKTKSRNNLKLNTKSKIISYIGHISEERGVGHLFEVLDKVNEKSEVLSLILAGKIAAGTELPVRKDTTYLGIIDHSQVPELIRASDINLVMYNKGGAGDVCLPTRFQEAVACKVPVLASSVGELEFILSDYPENSYRHNSKQDLHDKIISLLDDPKLVSYEVNSWSEIGNKFLSFLISIR